MKILITGGKGFLGSYLAPFLEKQGQEVVLFTGDVVDKASFNSYKDIEIVIHLASKLGGRDKKKIERVNVAGTKNVIEFCQRTRVKCLIFLSSIKALSGLSDIYVNSKREGEKLVLNSGLEYIIIRPSMLYGSGDKKNIGLLINLAKKLPLMPVIDFNTQPLLVNDLVKVIAGFLDNPGNKIYNVVGQKTVSCLEIYQLLKKNGYRFKILNWPRFFTFLIKIFSFLPGSPLPFWQVKSLLDKETFKGDDWVKKFKIKPTDFKEGIKKYA